MVYDPNRMSKYMKPPERNFAKIITPANEPDADIVPSNELIEEPSTKDEILESVPVKLEDRIAQANRERDDEIKRTHMTEGIAKMFGALAGTPVNVDLSDQRKNAQNRITDVLKKYDAQRTDPMSEASKQSQAMLKTLGINIPNIENMSAEMIDKYFPTLASVAKKKTGLSEFEQARLTEMGKNRAFRKEVFDENKRLREENKLDKDVEKISTRMEKSGMLERRRAMDDIDNYIRQMGGDLTSGKSPKDIPGVGFMTGLRPDFLTPKEAVSFRQNIQSLANQLLKQRSGAAVTDQEYKRFLEEVGKGNFSSEANLLDGLRKMKGDLDLQTTNILKSGSPNAQKEYLSRTGLTFNLNSGMVKMQAPNGEIREVPKDKVQKYLDKGAKVVN